MAYCAGELAINRSIFVQRSLLGFRTFVMVVISIALIAMEHRTAYLKPVRYALSTAVAPIQYVVDWPIELFDRVIDNFTRQQSLIKENASLKVQELLLRAQLQKLITLEKENAQLRKLLNPTIHTDTKMLAARVLAVDSEPYAHELVIDQGSQSGLYVGQPVVDANGIMGQIVGVGLLTSRVMLLTDPRSAIPVEVARNGVRSLVVGTGSPDYLAMKYVPETTNVKVGDRLVSSGLGQRFPIGYPVGSVASIKRQPGDSFSTILVKPSASVNRSRLVLLLWYGQENMRNAVEKQLHEIRQASKQVKKQAVTS